MKKIAVTIAWYSKQKVSLYVQEQPERLVITSAARAVISPDILKFVFAHFYAHRFFAAGIIQ
jgi:hypothetical protein